MNTAYLLMAIVGIMLSTSVFHTEGVYTLFKCSNDTDCANSMSGSTCNKVNGCQQGYCMCTNGKQNNTNQCVTPTVLLTNACTQNSDCVGAKSACVSGVCSCMQTQGAPTAANTDCAIIALGSACSTTTMGCGLFASCLGNTTTVCQCNAGFKPSSDGMNCAPYAQNDACDGTSQCGYPPNGFGYCDSTNHCVCNTTTSQWYDGLYMNINMGGCVPRTAQTGVAAGQVCTPTNLYATANPPIQVCADNLSCGLCPEDINTFKCQGTAVTRTTIAPSSNTTTASSGSLPSHVVCLATPVFSLVTLILTSIL